MTPIITVGCRRAVSPSQWRWTTGAISAGASAMLEPHAGIEEGVAHVDEEIDDDVDSREDQCHALDDRVVAAEDGVDREPADAGNGEDRLRDDDAADQQRDAAADHGDDRDRRVAQRVADQHLALGKALGLRRADIVLAQHLKHGGAGDAGDESAVDEAEHDARQDEMLDEGREALAEAGVALDRKPVEPDREAEDGDIGEDEGRHGESQHGYDHDETIDPAPDLRRRDDAQGNGEAQGNDESNYRQRHGRSDALPD